jgi:hypothetical protein
VSFDIVNRYTKAVLFHSDLAADVAVALKEAVASGAYLEGAYLRGANLEGAYLEGAILRGAYLEGAYLRGAYLEGAYLEGAILRGAYLEGAILRGAYLRGANLEGAYLEGAYLEGAILEGAYLRGAYLEGAYLEGAYLEGAYLRGAYLEGASGLLSNGTIPLQILATHHAIIVRTDGYLTIGCEHHPLVWWEEHYKAVGRRENYTDDQVAEYADHIATCRRWMERYGVVNVIEQKESVQQSVSD